MQDLGIFLPGEYRQHAIEAANDVQADSQRMVCSRQQGIVGGLALSLDDTAEDALAGISEREYRLLLEALRFYADRQHLTFGKFGISVEDGRRARSALAAIEGRELI